MLSIWIFICIVIKKISLFPNILSHSVIQKIAIFGTGTVKKMIPASYLFSFQMIIENEFQVTFISYEKK